MDAQTLVGKQAGTSMLQRVIGNGTLGAVYLGEQSQPARKVAVKVFLRLASLEPEQQHAFLTTFRDEMAHVFDLNHSHVLPIYDYGEVDGLAYITTPYIIGETLEEMQVHEGALPLQVVANILRQIAAALDYAHSRGVVHRDLKPANIFVTPEQKVWVADFHLTAMLVEGKTAHMRLSKPGLLDYMSPELIIGKPGDRRADLYSLGALLYSMVTGVPPFQGQTLMKVATKHLKMPPPSPRASRPDLPAAAEQVILKALAKNPAERFDTALDMALLFQQAINTSTSSRVPSHPLSPLPTSTNAFPALTAGQSTEPGGSINLPQAGTPIELASSSSTSLPSLDEFTLRNVQPAWRPPGSPLLFPKNVPEASYNSGDPGGRHAAASQGLALHGAVQANPLTPSEQTPAQATMVPGSIPWALPEIKGNESGITGTFKLTGPARIVGIPVAGQPGRYVTGILPASPQSAETSALPMPARGPVQHPSMQRWRLAIFVLAALLIVCGSVGFAFIHFASSKHPGISNITTAGTPNISATATAHAQASADANIIVSDALSSNVRGWPESSNGPFLYQFKGGAYHITNNDPSRVAIAILPGENLNRPFVYTLTMDEIRGDDTSINNESGMILRFNSQVNNGKHIVTFYSFEVVNNKEGQYQFWKYDNSQGPSANPWKQIANRAFGSEFHQGQGAAHSNTFKILVNGKNYTLIVNGKQVWSVQDSSLTGGQVGMLVNLKGTEVAFSNLLLTWS